MNIDIEICHNKISLCLHIHYIEYTLRGRDKLSDSFVTLKGLRG